jgi:hypothetical protein
MRKRDFLRTYGRYMLITESLFVISAILSLVLLALLRLPVSYYVQVIVIWFFLVHIHDIICLQVSAHEFFPRESLFLEFLHRSLYRLLLVLAIPAILLVFFVSLYFPREFWYQNPSLTRCQVMRGYLSVSWWFSFGMELV